MDERREIRAFVDSHAHPDNLDVVGPALRRANVEVWISSTGPEDFERAISASRSVPSKLFLGVHPSEAERLEAVSGLLEGLVGEADGLGEIGLDGKYNVPMEAQLKALRFQLELAERLGRPVVLHSRGAASLVLEELAMFNVPSALFHWFSGSDAELEGILDRGYYVSVGPTVLYSKRSRKVLSAVYERGLLLLETDSPVYYAPIGREADPTLIVSVYLAAAHSLHMSLDELAEEIWKNSRRFLGKGF